MDGGGDRVCVRDHAGCTRQDSTLAPQRQRNLQFYAFGCLDSNLGVPNPFPGILEVKYMFEKFLRDESGATAIEYSIIAGFIALAIIAAVGMTGQRLVELFESLIPALTR